MIGFLRALLRVFVYLLLVTGLAIMFVCRFNGGGVSSTSGYPSISTTETSSLENVLLQAAEPSTLIAPHSDSVCGLRLF